MIPLCERCHHGRNYHAAAGSNSRLCNLCYCAGYVAEDITKPAKLVAVDRGPEHIPGWVAGVPGEGEDVLELRYGPKNYEKTKACVQLYFRDLEYDASAPTGPDEYVLVWTTGGDGMICHWNKMSNSYSQVAVITNVSLAKEMVENLNRAARDGKS